MLENKRGADNSANGGTTLQSSDTLMPNPKVINVSPGPRSWQVVGQDSNLGVWPTTRRILLEGLGSWTAACGGQGQGGTRERRARGCAERWSRVQDEGHPLFSLDLGPWLLLHMPGETLEPRLAHLAHSQDLHLPQKPCSSLASQKHLQGHEGQPMSQAKSLVLLRLGFPAPRLITVINCCLMR